MAGRTELRQAEEVYERLQKLSCLPLKGMYVSGSQNIHELLCTPSVIRLGVLEWLCTRVYPPLQEQFSTLKEFEGEIKIKEMAKLGFELMLCQEGDVDLIKGLVPSGRQLLFMANLLDIIQMAPSVSRDLRLECSSQIVYQSDQNNENNQHLEELQKISTELHDLKEECTFLRSPVPASETVVQTLKLATTDFHQLIATFTRVYENEFQEHCNHPAPRLSPCGPLFRSVHRLLESCSKELEAVAKFTTTSNTITEVVRKRQQAKESWGGGSLATLHEKIKELKHNYELFLNSLQ
ncbi:unnamed protein product [Staurois parvus]|uniref:HAUS augmin-like complex subunit 7 n=1 Tax=Staurois parvus TaxID=386267 RepID=A0ABN9D2D5_9NEOB|nr:unnamed protein product [Staurois parvus]